MTSYEEMRRAAFYLKADVPLSDDELRALQSTKQADSAAGLASLTSACRALLDDDELSLSFMPGKGTFNSLFRIEHHEPAVVLRARIRQWPVPALDFLGDEWLSGTLHANGIPAARVVAADVSRRLCSYDLEIAEFVPGDALSRRAPAATVGALGAAMAGLHEIRSEGFGPLDVRTTIANGRAYGLLPSWRRYMLSRLPEHLDCCERAGAIAADERARIVAAFERFDTLLDLEESSVLHGDLGPHNVVTQGTEIAAILDWEDCVCGDPVFDIASWGTFLDNRDRLDALLNGYVRVRALPSDFASRYWLYFLRIALAKTVHRRRFGYGDPAGSPPPSRRIQAALEGLQRAPSGMPGR